MKRHKQQLLILTSTYPRWEDDTVPNFVEQFAFNMKDKADKIVVIAPHYKGARRTSKVKGVMVNRFRYAWPAKAQSLAYERGGVSSISVKPIYVLKLISYVVSMVFSVLRHTFKFKGDTVINGHWIVPQGFVAVVAARALRKKSIVTVHGSDIFTLNSKILKKVKRWTLKKADHVVVNSTATKSACEDLLRREYVVAPMGVDTADAHHKKRKPSTRNNEFIVGFIGRLSEEKGVKYLISAVGNLKAKGVNIKCMIAGDGPLKEELRNSIDNQGLSGFIELVGWIQEEEKQFFFNSIDVLVVPSVETELGRREAFGMVAAEAFVYGTAVIATDAGGLRDIVLHGENGLIVKQRDVEGLSDAIMKFISRPSLSNEFANKGLSHVRNNFSWSNTVAAYQKLMEVNA